jgi:hypothetical protein
MLDPATAQLCGWQLPLDGPFRLFSKPGSLGGSTRDRFSRTGQAKSALARHDFSRRLLENDRLREPRPCQRLNVRLFPNSETTPVSHHRRRAAQAAQAHQPRHGRRAPQETRRGPPAGRWGCRSCDL